MRDRKSLVLLAAFVVVAAACRRDQEPEDVIEDTVIRGSEESEPDRAGGAAPDSIPGRSRPASVEGDGADPAPPTLRRQPLTPDPENGDFTLAEATAGLPPGDQPLFAQIRTDLGRITCKLFADKAPRTVANFVGLARGLRPFWDARQADWVKRPAYDGSNFHRVIPGFMIQGGDPLRDGSGSPGYEIDDEVWAGARHDRAGLLCMANRGPDTNGQQFFITDAAAPHLDSSYTILGECGPTDVVARIARVPQSGRPRNRPLTDVSIEAIRIFRGEPPPPPAPPRPDLRPQQERDRTLPGAGAPFPGLPGPRPGPAPGAAPR